MFVLSTIVFELNTKSNHFIYFSLFPHHFMCCKQKTNIEHAPGHEPNLYVFVSLQRKTLNDNDGTAFKRSKWTALNILCENPPEVESLCIEKH